MAISYYDDALINKLNDWVGDQNIRITGPEETRRLFQYRADIGSDGPIQLPLITLRRSNDVQILDKNRKPLVFDGLTLNANKYQSDQLNGIPIYISYQIDIFTRYFKECDEYVRNFIFNLIKFPKLQIEIPYNNSNIVHDANVRLEGTVTNNSDIPERLIAGQFTRFTIPIYIDDAYIFDYRFRPNYQLEVETEVKFKDEK